MAEAASAARHRNLSRAAVTAADLPDPESYSERKAKAQQPDAQLETGVDDEGSRPLREALGSLYVVPAEIGCACCTPRR